LEPQWLFPALSADLARAHISLWERLNHSDSRWLIRIQTRKLERSFMALSDSEIREALNNRSLIIEPFEEASLNPAGYDLRLATGMELEASEHRLVATLEKVELSDELVGVLHIRSSMAREGIMASLALVDPGFRGQLTISLFNSGRRAVRLSAGERFVQLTVLRLGRKAASKYEGRYQDSQGAVSSRR